MSKKAERLDHYLADDGPAALVLRQPLMSVDGVIFPATFAAAENPRDFPGGYNIDHFGDKSDGKNICLVDSVGSQANRIEPIFDARNFEGRYGALVPQVTVTAGETEVSIFEAGHRAGDAIVRCSALQEDLQSAFRDVVRRDCTAMAKLAPTSLVFGVWDSRDTQAKLPRLITSTIRAFDVRELTRAAQFNPATEFVKNGLLPEPDKKTKDSYSERGFIHVPATGTHGGVIASGGVRREATLSLSALRLLKTNEPSETLALQRYILGLSLVAFTYASTGYRRAGCNLVIDPDGDGERVEVFGDGKRARFTMTHDEAFNYAEQMATDFGVGDDRRVNFDKKLATADLTAKK